MAKAHITLITCASEDENGRSLPVPSRRPKASTPVNAPATANATTWTEVATGVSNGSAAPLVVPNELSKFHLFEVQAIGGPIVFLVLNSADTAAITAIAATPNNFEGTYVAQNAAKAVGGLRGGDRVWVRDGVAS